MSTLKIYLDAIEYNHERAKILLEQLNINYPCESGVSWQISKNGKPEKVIDGEQKEFDGLSSKQLYDIAQFLYGLLDDIDCAKDLLSIDEYKETVNKIQDKKKEVVKECVWNQVVFKEKQ